MCLFCFPFAFLFLPHQLKAVDFGSTRAAFSQSASASNDPRYRMVDVFLRVTKEEQRVSPPACLHACAYIAMHAARCTLAFLFSCACSSLRWQSWCCTVGAAKSPVSPEGSAWKECDKERYDHGFRPGGREREGARERKAVEANVSQVDRSSGLLET